MTITRCDYLHAHTRRHVRFVARNWHGDALFTAVSPRERAAPVVQTAAAPGVVYPPVGGVPVYPAVSGMPYPQAGVVYPQPGMAYAQPGVPYPQATAAYGQAGMYGWNPAVGYVPGYSSGDFIRGRVGVDGGVGMSEKDGEEMYGGRVVTRFMSGDRGYEEAGMSRLEDRVLFRLIRGADGMRERLVSDSGVDLASILYRDQGLGNFGAEGATFDVVVGADMDVAVVVAALVCRIWMHTDAGGITY